MTLQEIRQALLDARYGEEFEGIMFRPTSGQTFFDGDAKEVIQAFDDLLTKVVLVEAGCDEFTAVEKLMFQLFVKHGELYA